MKMKFEFQDILGGDILENESRLKRVVEGINEKKALYQAKPEDFIGLPGYSEDEVRRELSRTQEQEKQWSGSRTDHERRQKMISDALEGVMVDQFSSDWFAGQGEGFFTSKPDDYLRGIDAVVEFTNEQTDKKDHVGFALDIAHVSSYGILEHKLNSAWKEVASGNLSEVKYFEDSDENKTSLKLSRVVVNVDKETVRDLIDLYSKKKKEELAKHKFQYNLILQVKMQLEAQYKFVSTYADIQDPTNRYNIATKEIGFALKYINDIYELKKDEIEKHRKEIEADPGFRQIKEFYEERAPDSRVLAA